MPITTQIENAEPLNGAQAIRLLSAMRASEYFQVNRSCYPDIDTKVKGRINRQRTITGATNANPIVIASVGHGFSDGEIISVDGVVGNLAANNTWVVGDALADSFSLVGSFGNGVYTFGGIAADMVSMHLSAVVAALDKLKDGTVGVKGGRDALDYSQVRDREALIAEALDSLYNVEIGGDTVAVGQRGGTCRACHWSYTGSNCTNPRCSGSQDYSFY